MTQRHNLTESKKEQVTAENSPWKKALMRISPQFAARKIQQKWKTVLYKDNELVNVKLGKKIKDDPFRFDFVYFLNNQNIKKSLNLPKRKALLVALNSANWHDKIFKDPELPYLAISLYMENKINMTQCTTILDRIATFKELQELETYPILDAKGTLTIEANEFLIPVLNRYEGFKKLEGETLRAFITAVKKLPKSEQVFYRTNVGPNMPLKWPFNVADRRLEHVLEVLGALHIDRPRNAIVHLSFGLTNLLNLARFGTRQAVLVMPKLGTFSPQDVEFARANNFRPRATAYPGTISDQANTSKMRIHGFEASNTAARVHDEHHANILASLPIPLRKALLQLANVTRINFEDTLSPNILKKMTDLLSKEIWEWIDCDFRFLVDHREKYIEDLDELYSDQPSEKTMTQYFCKMLLEGNHTDSSFNDIDTNQAKIINHSKGGYLVNLQGEPTAAGMGFFLNMIEYEYSWRKIKINPAYLISPFREIYQMVKENYHLVRTKDIHHTIFNCLLLFALKKENAEDYFQILSPYLLKEKEKINFIKYKGSENDELRKNRIYLTFNKQVIVNQRQLMDVIRNFLASQLRLQNWGSKIRNDIFSNSNMEIKNIFKKYPESDFQLKNSF